MRWWCVSLGLLCLAWSLPLSAPGNPLTTNSLEEISSDSAGIDFFERSKTYLLYVYDTNACSDGKCTDLLAAVEGSIPDSNTDKFGNFKGQVFYGKINSDNYPKYKKEIDRAKVTLPVVVLWTPGHLKPNYKFDDKPTKDNMVNWMIDKLKTENPASFMLCQVGEKHEELSSQVALECSDSTVTPSQNQLMQLEKTQKIWDPSTNDTKFVGPADNSLEHSLTTSVSAQVVVVDSTKYFEQTTQKKWQALYFYAPWCRFCGCLPPIWQSVSDNLVGSQRQPNLIVGEINGDDSGDLRNLFNVTVYPTFLLVNRDGTKVLGRYLGPRKVFEISNWIEDLIVADEAPVVKHQFDPSEQGPHADMHPVFPYSGQ